MLTNPSPELTDQRGAFIHNTVFSSLCPRVSRYIKDSIAKMGLKQIASEEKNQANGMTAIYLPEGVTAPELLPKLVAKGVIFAGGLHKEIATKYFRFGHMGVSVTTGELGHIEKALATSAAFCPVTSDASMIGSRVYRWLVPATMRASNSGTPASTYPW